MNSLASFIGCPHIDTYEYLDFHWRNREEVFVISISLLDGFSIQFFLVFKWWGVFVDVTWEVLEVFLFLQRVEEERWVGKSFNRILDNVILIMIKVF